MKSTPAVHRCVRQHEGRGQDERKAWRIGIGAEHQQYIPSITAVCLPRQGVGDEGALGVPEAQARDKGNELHPRENAVVAAKYGAALEVINVEEQVMVYEPGSRDRKRKGRPGVRLRLNPIT